MILSLALAVLMASGTEIPYGVAPFGREFGNHRACVEVSEKADAVRARLPWRRHDPTPQNKQVIVVDATTGKRLTNVVPLNVNPDFGDIAFQPVTVPGQYYIYYMPYVQTGWEAFPKVTYPEPKDAPDAAWLARVGDGNGLPEAKFLRFEARTERDRFDPMEVIATASETHALLASHPGPFLVFPEDRDHAIRMTDFLPQRWVKRGGPPPGIPVGFEGTASRGEFYVFQLGVWAARQPLSNVTVSVSAGLRAIASGTRTRGAAATISPKAFRCFNTGGTDWLGRPMKKTVAVAKGKVQALWCGMQVPADAKPGTYEGTLTVKAAGVPAQKVRMALTITPPLVKDGGDAELEHLSRLRWLDSTIGLDEEVTAPYTPLVVKGNTVGCLGREVRFGADGLPNSIRVGGKEILARPIRLAVQADLRSYDWAAARDTVLKKTQNCIAKQYEGSYVASWPVPEMGTYDDFLFEGRCLPTMEADGYINYRIALTAEKDADVEDISLIIPLRTVAVPYFMGLGRKGGFRPKEWEWKWDINHANNMFWLGDTNCGLDCKLKGIQDNWQLYALGEKGMPDAWYNGGKGGATVTELGDTVYVRVYSGPRQVKKGQVLHFNFGLLVTPVKPLDPAHWHQRYYHAVVPPQTAKDAGATIINIHQGNDLNPNINYPFLHTKEFAKYIADAHKLGLKVKAYYTVRELTDFVTEIWALRSLGHEIYTDGPGGGDSWLQEHLVSHYAPAWHTPLSDGQVDAAIATVGLSRWHNYYLEGLRRLMLDIGLDGLYLDGIGYNREIMKRVRKVLDRTRPGSLIDFHCGNDFAPEYGLCSPALEYMEHFPYLNSLWFGEGYNYNETPDYWLVEISGIPFGLYSEMLQDNGNPWRGMIYGMTARYYSGADPKHIWRLWDEFGIDKATMKGYWQPDCPVHTDNPAVLATAYVRDGKTLISLASWAPSPASVHLRFDWHALGLDPAKAHLTAPAVTGFQPAATFAPDAAIPVEPGKGWLLVVETSPPTIVIEELSK